MFSERLDNMINQKLKQPGTLVKFRGRRCVVQPSNDAELILLKPLGGSDEETMAVFEPILRHNETIEVDKFEYPSVKDLDSFLTARLLYDAARLSFRQVSGPFRCMGKLSFRPRSYQLVPLIMALKQNVTRLLIADDVGIGKTVEGLLIVRELLERGIIKRFAVLCPPHLCDQWQKELADKLDIEAEIIRSSTVAGLERKIVGDDMDNVFSYYPFQVISIDYVKGDSKKPIFLKDAPEMIIVDEAHTCARPQNQRDNQQQRFHLLKDLSEDASRHLILLTATPHSGKDQEFQSVLALLNKEFEDYDLSNLTTSEKRKMAAHFIQRKRKNIEKWLNEDTPFPKRRTEELPYKLTASYLELYEDVLQFARGINSGDISANKARIRFFAVLTLLRGVMSSPAAGAEMLMKRRDKSSAPEVTEADETTDNPAVEKWDEQNDTEQVELIDKAGLSEKEWTLLNKLSQKASTLGGPEKDRKLELALEQVRRWLKENKSPIIFCRFIATAKYLAEHLKANLPAGVDVRGITSEMSDDERREKIDEMKNSSSRVLVATDCLSEGINLQEGFNAVLHYDLPWNPNRLEQREGRVDRYGQTAPEVDVRLLFGEDNPIDVVVLKIIIEKIKNIQSTSGVSISIAEDNRSVMDKVLREVIFSPSFANKLPGKQMRLDFEADKNLSAYDLGLTNEIERAREKAEVIRSIFAHESIKPEDVDKDLKEVDEAIGDVETLEQFVVRAAELLGAIMARHKEGYMFQPKNMDAWLVEALGKGEKIHISFTSPTPAGYRYIGRNHRFVEQLCHRIISNSLDPQRNNQKAARASVFRTDSVKLQTTLIQFRVRNVIREVGRKHEMVSEEMYLWGYEQGEKGIKALDMEECKRLLNNANALDIPAERQKSLFESELKHFEELHPDFIKVVEDRSNELVDAHTRFAKYLGAKRFEAVTPVLPPDILGVYVLIPNPAI
jgi:superfamily II DNA or RNA helicase